jgi:hypothetical protein
MEGGQYHEHIAGVEWVHQPGGAAQQSTREQVVEFIDKNNGDVRVRDGQRDVHVGVVKESVRMPYIRTHADGKWSNNLLALPRY